MWSIVFGTCIFVVLWAGLEGVVFGTCMGSWLKGGARECRVVFGTYGSFFLWMGGVRECRFVFELYRRS